jgi:hypothetical protein
VSLPPVRIRIYLSSHDDHLLNITDLGTGLYQSFPWQPASDTNPTTAFFVPLVWRDEVLFHATLQFSAIRMDSEIVKSCGVNTTLLSAECIRLLRDRVENSEEGGGLKDETISAVATLAAVEVSTLHFKTEFSGQELADLKINSIRRAISVCFGCT